MKRKYTTTRTIRQLDENERDALSISTMKNEIFIFIFILNVLDDS